MTPTDIPFLNYSTWLRGKLPFPVQKLSVHGGFTCPNRDGTLSKKGCVYCNNNSFVPNYCQPRMSVSEQLEAGKQFFRKKHPEMKFLAYFQSYSNTYAKLSDLQQKYEDALSVKDVVGIVLSTRPDCLSEPVLKYLQNLARKTFLILEIGVESTDDAMLCNINRGHDFACSVDAVQRAADVHNLIVGIHLIAGLPGTIHSKEIEAIDVINKLPISLLKLHQLQIIRDTPLAAQYCDKPFPLFTPDEYLKHVADILERLRPDIVMERFLSQSPPDMVIAPQWKMKNHEFTHKLIHYMNANGMYQGRLWKD